VVAEHCERSGLVDAVAFHQDALGALGGGAAAECALEVVVFGEAAKDDVDRALPVVGVGVVDVREDSAFSCFFDELGVPGVEQHDDWAGGFAHDLVDQIERVRGARDGRDARPPSYCACRVASDLAARIVRL
jgi:hypothetical protein